MTRPIFSWRHAVLQSDLPPTTRHVLLTLSCHMNDAGESCFPSVATLVKETGLSNRSVIDHIKLAKKAGWIKVGLHGFGGQKWRSHEYTCAIPDSVAATERGERASPAQEKGGEPLSIDGAEGGEPLSNKVVKEVHSISTSNNSTQSKENSTREAPPDGDGLVIEQPPVQPSPKPPKPTDIDLPNWLDPELWAMWCDERKARRKPVTARAAKLQLKQLAEYREQGFSPQAVIEHSIASGYQGLFPPRGNDNAKQPTSIVERVRANMEQYRRQGATYDCNGNPVDPPF